MSALQNQTSLNPTTFFFATKAAGEQDLYTSSITAGAFSDFAVGITGGNLVQINQMPDVIGTVTAGGGEMLYAGTASTYKTLSSLSGTAVGTSISIDRTAGSGITCIEAYGGNGAIRGFEFLCRGVNSAVEATSVPAYNGFLSSIGYPGASAFLNPNGVLGTAQFNGVEYTSVDTAAATKACYSIFDLSGAAGVTPQARWTLGTKGLTTGGNAGTDFTLVGFDDAGGSPIETLSVRRSDGAMNILNLSSVNGVPYPASIISTPQFASTVVTSVPNASPTVVFTLPSVGLTAGALYQSRVMANLTIANPSSNECYLELGLRCGGNGTTINQPPIYVPTTGSGFALATSIQTIAQCGTSNSDVDIIAYQQNAGSSALDITINTVTPNPGIPDHLFKQIT